MVRKGKGIEEGRAREFGMDMYTQLCLGPLVQQRELCSMLPGSLDGRLGGMNTCICTAEAGSFTVHLKRSQHC